MGFRSGAWMSVFGVYPVTDKVVKILGATSMKNKATGEYENDFSGYCSCLGESAARKAMQLKPTSGNPARIHLGDVEVKHTFKPAAKEGEWPEVEYINYNIYDFDLGEDFTTNQNQGNRNPSYQDQLNTAYDGINDDPDEEGLPF